MADTFLQAVKATCDAVPNFSPLILDQRPEDVPQLPSDVVVHIGQVPTAFSNCGQQPRFVDDRFEVIIYRENLITCEAIARALMEVWNDTALAFTGVSLVKVYRESYRAGMVLREDGSPARTANGQAVYAASVQYLAQYAPEF